MIDGSTKLVGLIGDPVEHSLSPAMHNAAFDVLGLNWRYIPLPVVPDRLDEAVRGLAALGFRGANVTVPHKQTVMSALDSIAPGASTLGAVNTIVVDRREGKGAVLNGHNTDHKGFVIALRHEGFDPESKRAVVVGAGGAGRAVVYGLLEANAAEILVLDIDSQKTETLISDLAGSAAATTLHTLSLTPETLVESVRASDLLVNATPVGMWPKVEGSIWPDDVSIPAQLVVFDLVYNPPRTHLLKQAEASGARPIRGLEMLVRQGALAFELWIGRLAPIRVMRTACEQALRQSLRRG